MITFGEKLKYLRLRDHLTQKFLGMAVGFPENQAEVRIAQYESGSRKPGMNTTLKLADALGVSPDILMVPALTELWEYEAAEFWEDRLPEVQKLLYEGHNQNNSRKGDKRL